VGNGAIVSSSLPIPLTPPLDEIEILRMIKMKFKVKKNKR
jgi:hypothetical protein